MKYYLFLLFVTLSILGAESSLDKCYAASPVNIKFATLAPEGSVWMKHMRLLEKKLLTKSNGRLKFKMYPGGILGDESGMLRKIWNGQIHCAAFSGEGISKILPSVRILDLPFLFRDYQEVDRVHIALQNYYSNEFEKKGFQLISWAEVGYVYLFSKKPIRRLSDLSHLKIWTASGDPISKMTFSAMGINPIPLAITDVTIALNTGMIDTFYAPPLGALALQWHMSMKYMTSLPLAHATGAVLISSKIFRKIPGNLSRLFIDEFQKEMAALTKNLRVQTDEAMVLIEKSGLKIIPIPSGNELKTFYEIHDKVTEMLTKRNPGDYPKSVIEKVYKILNKNSSS